MPSSEWLTSDALMPSARLQPFTWDEVPGWSPAGGLAFHCSWTDIPQEGDKRELIMAIASTTRPGRQPKHLLLCLGFYLLPSLLPLLSLFSPTLPTPQSWCCSEPCAQGSGRSEIPGPRPQSMGSEWGDSLTADSDKCLFLAQTKGVISNWGFISASFRKVLLPSVGSF